MKGVFYKISSQEKCGILKNKELYSFNRFQFQSKRKKKASSANIFLFFKFIFTLSTNNAKLKDVFKNIDFLWWYLFYIRHWVTSLLNLFYILKVRRMLKDKQIINKLKKKLFNYFQMKRIYFSKKSVTLQNNVISGLRITWIRILKH